MTSDREQICEFVKSLGQDFHYRIKALAKDPDYRPGPRVWPDDPDPFGIDWKWLEPPVSESDHVSRAPSQLTWKRLATTALVAASLLICGVIFDRMVLRKPAADGPGEILVAQAGTMRVAERDPRTRVPAVEITSPLSGFVTLVSLAPGRRPLVLPALGGEYYQVSLNQRTDPIPLPKDTSDVVFVVTETPSGESIRRIEDSLREFRPGDEELIRQRIEQTLLELGYRRMAFGEGSFDEN